MLDRLGGNLLNLKGALSGSSSKEARSSLALSCGRKHNIIFIKYIQGGAVNRGQNVFFHYVGLHVILKLLLGLKRTVLCGLDPWLTIRSILTSFFLATA